MAIKRLRFHIQGTTPETCPMDDLLSILKKLATVSGSKEHVHLLNVDDGSLTPVIGVEEEKYEEVTLRVRDASRGKGRKESVDSYRELISQLERDNLKAELMDEETDEIIQEFYPKPEENKETFGPFWQQGFLYGYLRRLEGSDSTDHATLVYDGGKCNCEMSEAIGQRLSKFYRHTVKVYGKGHWLRHGDGKWELKRFVVEDFEELEDKSLIEVVERLRAIPNNDLMKLEDPLAEMQKIREGEY